QRGNAFVPCRSRDLERIFSLQFERSVNRDNTVSFQNLSLQIERVRWRSTLAAQRCYSVEQGKGNCPLPLQPHPQNQPNPIGEGTTLKPDISLATKSGHFNLLPTRRKLLLQNTNNQCLILLSAPLSSCLPYQQ